MLDVPILEIKSFFRNKILDDPREMDLSFSFRIKNNDLFSER